MKANSRFTTNIAIATIIFLTSLFGGPRQGLAASITGQCEALFKPEPQQASTLKSIIETNDFLDKFETEALRFAREFMPTNAARVQAVTSWAETLDSSTRSGRKLSIVEHTTLQLVLRTQNLGLLDGLQPEILAKLKLSFVNSRQSLTGKSVRYDDAIHLPLPRTALMDSPTNVQSFNRLVAKIDPTTMTVKSGKFETLLKKVMPLTLLAFGVTGAYGMQAMGMDPIAASALSAFALGKLMSVAYEYFFHGNIMHGGFQGKRLPKFWQSPLTPEAMRANGTKHADLHASHHNMVNRANYVITPDGIPIATPDIKTHLERLAKLGVPAETLKVFSEKTKHGLHSEMTMKDQLTMFMILGPPAALLGALTGQVWYVSAPLAAIVSQAWIYNIYLLHGSYHVTGTDVFLGRKDALAHSNKIARWYLSSSMFREAYLAHYVHHSNVKSNYQLFPMFGLDALMGTRAEPTLADLILMLQQDLNF